MTGPADRDDLRDRLARAIRGTTDGGLIPPDSDIPAGEAERLAWEFICEHIAVAVAAERERIAAAIEELPGPITRALLNGRRGTRRSICWRSRKQFRVPERRPPMASREAQIRVSLSDLPQIKEAFVALQAERDDLAARLEWAEAFIRDLAEHGLRADLNPTVNMFSADTVYTHLVEYLTRLDTGISARARRALDAAPAAGQPGDGETGRRA